MGELASRTAGCHRSARCRAADWLGPIASSASARAGALLDGRIAFLSREGRPDLVGWDRLRTKIQQGSVRQGYRLDRPDLDAFTSGQPDEPSVVGGCRRCDGERNHHASCGCKERDSPLHWSSLSMPDASAARLRPLRRTYGDIDRAPTKPPCKCEGMLASVARPHSGRGRSQSEPCAQYRRTTLGNSSTSIGLAI